MMKIKYIGHACFLLETSGGTRIITDPYEPGSFDGAVKYKPVGEGADIVLVSHGHADHNYTASVSGNPRIVEQAGSYNIEGISILGVSTYHDMSGGSERGTNIIFRMMTDGIAVCHMGDIGHTLDEATARQLRPVDILMMPVGGFFTVGSDEADSLINSLTPGLVIPMHFKTEGVDFPIAPVDEFLSGRKEVLWEEGSEVEVTAGNLPEGVMVLNPANLP
jgi:L-ascorbate metabolism protein UlaG (beta-lactamase superfamily)